MTRHPFHKPRLGRSARIAVGDGRCAPASTRAAFAALLALALATPVGAQIMVVDPWARAVVAGQKTTGAYLQIRSATDATLVAVTSPAAKIVEIHEMRMDGGVMKMNAVEKLPLPAGKLVDLNPGGYHVMLMDLKAPLKEGDTVPLTLTIVDKAGRAKTVEVIAKVRPLTASAPPRK